VKPFNGQQPEAVRCAWCSRRTPATVIRRHHDKPGRLGYSEKPVVAAMAIAAG